MPTRSRTRMVQPEALVLERSADLIVIFSAANAV
jgi:hypothetical protein